MQTSVDSKRTAREQFYFPLLIALMAILSYVRILLLDNVFWDDHFWIEAIFTSNNLFEFLNTGFYELRRVPQGIVLYVILTPFKFVNNAYIILHIITIITLIITPVFIYLLIYDLFNNRLAAFIIGSILIIYPVDTTVPALNTLPYKLGLMLSVISFFITQRALATKINWGYITIALLLSMISNYFFVEGTIALEPARLCMIGFILNSKGYTKKDVIKYSITYWLPFFLLCVPIIVYKLFYKPYGLYAGAYHSDWLFFLRVRSLHLSYLAMLLGKNWVYLLGKIKYLSSWSVINALVASITSYFILKRYAADSGFKEIGDIYICPDPKSSISLIKMIFLFGLLLLVPVVIMYEYAGRGMTAGFTSRHSCIMQFGNALIIGSLICIIFNKIFSTSKYKKQYIALSMAALFGFGIFFNNLNLDLYFKVWNLEKQFYQAFMERFPALPEKSDFMFDVELGTYDELYHLSNFEFPLNMLYAKSSKPKEFREHKVTSWYFLNTYKKIGGTKYETLFHWGKDIYDTRNLIVIRWKPGEFLVNREIVEKYPEVEYKWLADKDIPLIPSASTYPLRKKMNHFLGK